MTGEQQLRTFIAKFTVANQRLIRGLRSALRQQLPGAHELVYDNYNFLVIAYCPTKKTADSYFSIGTDKSGANLFFGYNGSRLEDPTHLLQGKGAKNRFMRLPSVELLVRPDVQALIAAAIAFSKPMEDGRGELIIRSISSKQRPRQ